MTNMVQNSTENNTLPPLVEMLEAARRYAERGLAVVPIPRGEKGPRLSGWQRLATTDQSQHQVWFPAAIPANIGIATGEASNVFALDVDFEPGGPETLAELERRHGPLPVTPMQLTPTGGRHYLFTLPEGAPVKNSVKTLGAGLDVRGKGGVIVAAPSLHPDGGHYQWGEGRAPWEIPVAEAPDWLVALIRADDKPPSKHKPPGGERRVRRVEQGTRNNDLFREASRLRGQGFDLDQITALLHIFNAKHCVPPCDDAEVEKCASQGGAYPPNEHYELNDTGNALRFARDHGEGVRFVADLGVWRTWTGTHWEDDPAGLAVMARARETVELMKEDAEAVTSEDFAKALRRHARLSGDRARLRAMTDVAASLPGMAAISTDFDQMLGRLAVANGVVDLTNGELSPHDPLNLNTKCLPAAYQPDAAAPRFSAFMEQVQPDPGVRTFLQRYLGQALHGRRDEQLMTWWHGRGRNGKSVLADTLLGLLPGYAIECPSSTFLTDDKRAPNAPRPDILRLQGARLVLGSEVADGRRADGALLKELTGNATKTVRGLYKSETTFPITFNMAILVNPWPRADEADDALWTRFVRVPFEVVIPLEEQVKNLDKLLVAEEAEGILAWLVQGAVGYTVHGLVVPPVLVEATRVWRRRIGTIEQYMRTYTRPAPGNRMPLTELHAKYVKAVQQTYGNPVGSVNFRSRLEGLGYAVADEEFGETVRDVRIAPITSVWVSEAMQKDAA